MMRFWFVSLLLSLGFPAFAAITVSIGERQTIPAGSISEKVGFKVVDDLGNPSSGVTVNLSLIDSTDDPVLGSLSEKTADTDSTGQVFTKIESIEVADTYTFMATLATDETQFASTSMRIVAGRPTTLTATGGANQLIPLGQDSESIQFQLSDAFGNAIEDSAIFLTLVPQSGNTGKLTPSGGGAMTDDNGEVSTRLEATDTQGSYLIIAHSAANNTLLASAEVFVIDSIPDLPELGIGQAIDASGQSLETQASFTGGVSVNSTPKENVQPDDLVFIQGNVQHDDLVFIQGIITPDNDHIGQTADIIVVASYIPFATTEQEQQFLYMLNNRGKTIKWDGDIASIVAFRRNITLYETQMVNIYSSKFLATGTLDIWFGYRLADDTIVANIGHPFSINILPPKLGSGIGQAVNAKGNKLEIVATAASFFTKGVLVNDTVKENVQSDEVVSIQGIIMPDSYDIGQTADIIVGASYIPFATTKQEQQFLYMLNNRGKTIKWDGKMASIVAFKPNVTLSETPLVVNIYNEPFLITGEVEIWFGYRLENGTLVYSNDEILVTVE